MPEFPERTEIMSLSGRKQVQDMFNPGGLDVAIPEMG
jgi:hypothetical protein